MLTQSERLGRLVEQLLDLSKLESGEVPLHREEVPLARARVAGGLRDRGRTVRPGRRGAQRAWPTICRRWTPTASACTRCCSTSSTTPSGSRPRAARWRSKPHRHNGSVEVTVADTGVGHRRRAPAAALRALLPGRLGPRARGRGHRHRPRDRALRRGGARGPHQGRERAGPGERVHVRPAGRRGGRDDKEGAVKSTTTTITVTARSATTTST